MQVKGGGPGGYLPRPASLFGAGRPRSDPRDLGIFLHRYKEPRKAAPDLAWLAEGFPHTEGGRWAARELSEIKEEMKRERGGFAASF